MEICCRKEESGVVQPKIVVEGESGVVEEAEAEKTFQGGFFSIKSPIRLR